MPPPVPRPRRPSDGHESALAQALDLAREAVFGVQPDGRFFYVNEAACEGLGYRRDDLLAMAVADIDPLFPADTWASHWEEVRQVGSLTLETIHRRKDGREFPVEVMTSILSLEGAERMFAYARDLTARHQAEAARRAQEAETRSAHALLQAMLESPRGVIVFSLDLDYRYTFFTHSHREAMRRVRGIEIQPGMDLVAAVDDPDLRARFKANLDRALAGEQFTLQESFGETGGFRRHWENRYGPVRDAAGVVIGVTVFATDTSERRRAEEALAASEEQFRDLYQNMAQGVVYQDPDGRILSANPAAERILGLSTDQMLGRTSMDPRWRTIRPNGDPFPGEEHPAMVALQTGRPVLGVTMGVFHPLRGSYGWILVDAVPEFRAGEPHPFRVYATFTDITELKRAQDELATAERKLQTVVSNSQAVIYQLDAEGRFLLSEGLGLRGLGLEPGQVVGQSAFELYADHLQILAQLRTALAGSAVRELTEVGGMAFDHFLTPVFGEDGRLESIIGIATDVTARRQAEAALQASEAQLRTVTENAPDTILMVDRGGLIRYVNHLAPGLSEAEVLGSHVTRWVPENQADLVRRYLDEAFQLGAQRAYESFGPGPGGLTRYFSVRIQPVVVDGRALNVVYTATDITKRKSAEDQLRASEARYRALYEQTPVMLHSIDREGRLVNVSDLWLSRLGYAREDVIGRPTTDFLTEASARFARESVLPEFFRTGTCTNVPYQFITRQGELVEVLLSATGERDEAGDIRSSLAVLTEVTEQKRALAALHRSEAKFGALFAAMTEGVAIHEIVRDSRGSAVDYRILEVNPAFEGHVGIPASRATGALASELYGVGHAPLLELYAEVAASGQPQTFERFFPPLHKHFRIGAVGLDPDHFATIFEDITDRISNLEALRRSEASYRGLFDGVHEAIYIQDRSGRFLDVNRGAVEMYGYPREDFIGRTPEFLSAPGLNDLPRVGACIERAFAGEPQQFEFWGLRRNGEVFPKEVRLYPGTYFGQEAIVALSIDISARRRAEAALKESEARFRSLYEHTPDAMFWIRVEPDGSFVVDDVNPTEERLLGQPKAALVGRRIQDLLPEAQASQVLANFRACIAGGVPTAYEEKVELPQGAMVFQTQLVPLLDDGGRAYRIIGTARDITLQRTAEEALRQGQKLESLGVLAGGIAHDFNNLLTAMMGNLNLAQLNVDVNAPAWSYLDAVERTVLKASELTKQMLAYSGKGRFLVKAQDLNAIVQEMLHLLQVSISKKADLRIQLQEGLPSILAEAAQVQQVVMNLVTNASDALGAQQGVIRVATSAERLEADRIHRQFQGQDLQPGNYVVLEVADTGCGIPEELMGRIFDPFFTTKASGRGLGLSALLGILRGHKAGIRIHSEPGKGSTFELFFPAYQDPVAAAAPTEAARAGGLSGRVLLVDDEEMILQSTGMALESLGLEVVLAHDGVQGLERFLELAPQLSLVLMDLSMPRMDGATAFLAMHEAHPEVPVLLSSGYDPQEPKEDLLGKGLAGFIQKPYRIRDLAKVVADAIANRPR